MPLASAPIAVMTAMAIATVELDGEFLSIVRAHKDQEKEVEGVAGPAEQACQHDAYLLTGPT
jgi:hypothetical protein